MLLHTVTRASIFNPKTFTGWQLPRTEEATPVKVARLIVAKALMMADADPCRCYDSGEYNEWLFHLRGIRRSICTFHTFRVGETMYHAAIGSRREQDQVNDILGVCYFGAETEWDTYLEPQDIY